MPRPAHFIGLLALTLCTSIHNFGWAISPKKRHTIKMDNASGTVNEPANDSTTPSNNKPASAPRLTILGVVLVIYPVI
ncbi:hypothetical protein L3X38_041633 [Prunus dulcis]|uniref:Uncharacterized protein n=1 Tax=Prunus dulcis TaxID=3755 RepID=A0AAD4YKJ9_PRUDU|nr:hypothetical protein L3X38_041633 [Prunus dulcis]